MNWIPLGYHAAKAVLVSTVLATLPALASGSLSEEEIQAGLDEIFQAWNSSDTPGAAVAILRDGEVAYEAFYGMANVEQKVPISNTTVFDIGSVAKQFVGFAIATLAAKGKIDLEADYRRYLPEMADYGTPVTVRDLIHHTSGIRDWPGALLFAGYSFQDLITKGHVLGLAKNLKELNFAPGTNFKYSSTNYVLLAEMVSRIAERPYHEWVSEQVFLPLQMGNTLVRDRSSLPIQNLANGYWRETDGEFGVYPSTRTIPGSPVFTTLNDMVSWVQALDQGAPLDPKVVELIYGEPPRLEDGRANENGFGWFHGMHRGFETLHHSGGTFGFAAFVLRMPAQRLSVVLLANSGTLIAQDHALKAIGLLLGEEANPDPGPDPQLLEQLSTSELLAYEGEYWSRNMNAKRKLYVKDGSLVYGRGGNDSTLFSIGDQCFQFVEHSNNSVCFSRDTDSAQANYVDFFVGDILLERMKPIPKFDSDGINLEEYVGDYHSEELDITVRLRSKSGQLWYSSLIADEAALEALFPDFFQSYQVVWEFLRDPKGEVTAYTLSDARNSNVRFVRMRQD